METRTLLRSPTVAPDAPRRLVGYAAVFNSQSRVITEKGRTFREEILPGAFTRSLKSPILGDLVALWQHETQRPPLGRTPDTLRVAEDSTGLRFEIDLPDSAADIYEAVNRRDVRGVSFGMNPATVRSTWSVREGMPYRQIEDLDLLEISLVVHPAYLGTGVSSRSLIEIPNSIDHRIELARLRLQIAERG